MHDGMSDGMDVYLGRSLKNWSARHRPPADGRRRLLRTLLTSPAIPQDRLMARFVAFLQNRNRISMQEAYIYTARPVDSTTISQAWYWHITMNWRLERLTV